MAKVVMDFPTAWAFVRTTQMESHQQKCSYRQMDGAILCDCDVLNEEYKRREDEQDKKEESNG